MESATAQSHTALVTVSLTLTDREGNSQSETKEIPGGPTKVDKLKTELGIADTDSLWVIDKSGKKKPLGDHESHDVKQSDRYEALVRGGVS